tara:strand:+ start:23088 stop:24119 length:1032 start_codon:yes stop_codon:yes gene_type:complete
MKYTIDEISKMINGKIVGDPTVKISSVSKIEDASIGDLCFLSNSKYTNHVYNTKASAIIIDENITLEKKVNTSLIVVKDSYYSFIKLLKLYHSNTNKTGISKLASFEENYKIGKNCYIGDFSYFGKNVVIEENVQIYPHCFIGDNCIIKKETILYPGVKIYNDCVIGENNIIHSGSVIGSDGFGFAPKKEGNFEKIPQIGNVITHSFVEIGANTSVDRATMGSTIINHGVKLDNQIQIGHNVEIGENTVIAGMVGIAGSTKIGKNCMIGGSSGIAGHLNIGNNVKIAGHTGVGSNIKDGETIQGPYAFNQKDFLRSYIIFKKLPRMYATLESIKKSLKKNNEM